MEENKENKENEELLVGNEIKNNSFFQKILIFLLFHLLYLIIPFFILFFPFLILYFTTNIYFKTISIIFIIIYWGNILTSKVHKEYGTPWKEFENNFIVRFIIEWLPVKIFRKTKLNTQQLYVFACHPHGTLAFNRAAVGFSTLTLWKKAFPGINFRVLTASAAFYVPFIRELWLWSSCVDASKKTAVKVMRNIHSSIFVYPGGEKEQIGTIYGKNQIMNSRKGFIRLAIEEGADLVPVYSFGEVNLYKHSTFLLKFRKYLVSKFGVAIPLIYGEYGLMPYRNKVTLVFGSPIKVIQNEKPTDEEIDRLHKIFYDELEKLFDEYKERFGDKNEKLEFMKD